MIFLLLSTGFFNFIPVYSHADSLPLGNAKAHAEILRELYQVVLLKVPQDRSTFGNWVDSLNQGASIEGVYNGFTHSKEYRDFEKQETTKAKPEAVQIFTEQWFYFQRELKKKSELHSSEALPLREANFSELGKTTSFSNASYSLLSQPGATILSQESVVKRAFSKASIYTLKRVLGDQALLWVAEGRHENATQSAGSKPRFPLNYANWVLDGLRSHIDFGLSLRNRDDADFHAQWAARELKSKSGLLEWEVLNRIHRLINAKQWVAQAATQGATP